MRSDSSVSAIIMTPDQPLTPGTSSRPVSAFLEHEQDMADLTAEMALLDGGLNEDFMLCIAGCNTSANWRVTSGRVGRV